MNNAKHTKGPWEVRHVDTMVHNKAILPERYCEILMPSNDAAFVTGKHDEANARLISAAPDLLEACKAAEKVADELMTECVSKKRAAKWDIINDGLCKVAAAIRKAERK